MTKWYIDGLAMGVDRRLLERKGWVGTGFGIVEAFVVAGRLSHFHFRRSRHFQVIRDELKSTHVASCIFILFFYHPSWIFETLFTCGGYAPFLYGRNGSGSRSKGRIVTCIPTWEDLCQRLLTAESHRYVCEDVLHWRLALLLLFSRFAFYFGLRFSVSGVLGICEGRETYLASQAVLSVLCTHEWRVLAHQKHS
jgi:hypothetical protein